MEGNVNQPPQVPSQAQVKQALADVPGLKCKFCQAPISDNEYFCHACGKKLKEPPFKFSWTKIIGIMLLSVLLPPLGIFPGIRHLRMPDQRAKIVGATAIVLTILATIITIKIFADYMNSLNSQLGQMNSLQEFINSPTGSVQDQAKQLQNLEQ